MINNVTLIYDKDKIDYARSLAIAIIHDLYDIDCMLFDAVMKIAYAPGIAEIEFENNAIDMRIPEVYMIQSRQKSKMIYDTISKQIVTIDQYIQPTAPVVETTVKKTEGVSEVQQNNATNLGLTGVAIAAATGIATGVGTVIADNNKKGKKESEEEEKEKTE